MERTERNAITAAYHALVAARRGLTDAPPLTAEDERIIARYTRMECAALTSYALSDPEVPVHE